MLQMKQSASRNNSSGATRDGSVWNAPRTTNRASIRVPAAQTKLVPTNIAFAPQISPSAALPVVHTQSPYPTTLQPLRGPCPLLLCPRAVRPIHVTTPPASSMPSTESMQLVRFESNYIVYAQKNIENNRFRAASACELPGCFWLLSCWLSLHAS